MDNQELKSKLASALADWLPEKMADWKVPGTGIAVIKDGEVILAEGYGVRDREKGLPVTADTIFAIGSSTKAFAAASVALAGSLQAPSVGALAGGTALALTAAALSTAMGVGVAALVGSRGPVIGILLAFFLAVEPVLQQLSFLGNGRQAIPSVALHRIGDLPAVSDIHVALGGAIAVVIAWAAAAVAAGAWRTQTREI